MSLRYILHYILHTYTHLYIRICGYVLPSSALLCSSPGRKNRYSHVIRTHVCVCSNIHTHNYTCSARCQFPPLAFGFMPGPICPLTLCPTIFCHLTRTTLQKTDVVPGSAPLVITEFPVHCSLFDFFFNEVHLYCGWFLHAYMHIFVYACICVSIVRMHVFSCVCIVCMYVLVCLHVCMYVCMYIRTYSLWFGGIFVLDSRLVFSSEATWVYMHASMPK